MAWPLPEVELPPIEYAAHSRRMTKKHFALQSPAVLRDLAERRRRGETFEQFARELGCHPDYVRVVLQRSGLLDRPDRRERTARQIAREKFAETNTRRE